MDCIPLSIKNFLSDPNVVFVGIGVEEIMSKLKNEYGLKQNCIFRLVALENPA